MPKHIETIEDHELDADIDRFLELADAEVTASLDAIADEFNPSRQRVRRCRECRCTDAEACVGGCAWVDADLCSRCA